MKDSKTKTTIDTFFYITDKIAERLACYALYALIIWGVATWIGII